MSEERERARARERERERERARARRYLSIIQPLFYKRREREPPCMYPPPHMTWPQALSLNEATTAEGIITQRSDNALALLKQNTK